MAAVDKRRMCPHCRAFITTDDKVCPYCDTPVGPRAIDVRQPGELLGGLIPHAHFTTVLILLVNFGIYIATAIYAIQMHRGNFFDLDTTTLYLFGAKFGPRIVQSGDWWRLITAGFLHGGIIHIGMNCWVLYDLGAQVEEAYGTARFLVIYFITSVAGFYCSMLWRPMTPSVGASAALFGLIGAMIALGTRAGTSQGHALRSAYVRWAIYGMLMGVLIPQVDNAAHLGGLAAGFVLGYIVGTPRLVGGQESFWKGAAAVCIMATVWAFYKAITFLIFAAPQLQ
jgi:rhomboid protease GluP